VIKRMKVAPSETPVAPPEAPAKAEHEADAAPQPAG
jgi:hypothetical protein